MKENRIEVGDIVRATTRDDQVFEGIVDYIPQATGDSWVILHGHGDMPVYVQSFEYMILMKKSPRY